ncbi:PLP-dependent aminotransferase family protein [Halomonas sp. HMF6819]|uniref:PLP-dependent aminotransferase family protein n=1 Tax=Halomonas sp. HMF6819 TaxID=3373085 RepID=UPI00379AA315
MQTAKRLERIQPSFIRDILSAASESNILSLAGGLPASDHFPLALMANPMAQLAHDPTLFQYGETQGYGPLLSHLKEHYSISEMHRMLICSGSQQGLDLIARAFLNPGEGVAMEAPGYPGALQVFALSGGMIHSVAQNVNGPDIAMLETLFASKKVKMFYAVPDFHNPTGVSWTLEIRQKVATLCRQYDIALVEDAPYRELRFTGDHLPMVSSFCPERALVLRSFSKIATPGIRLGMLSAPAQWLSALLKVKQAADLHSGVPMQSLLLSLLSNPEFPSYIKRLCQCYGERYQALANALESYLGGAFEFASVQGGMFIWLRIPGGDPLDIAKRALSKGVAVVPGNAFYHDDFLPSEAALRLNFSHACPSTLREAVRRLATLLV